MMIVNRDRDSTARRRVMAFEMQTGGHHPSYIRNFSEQWAKSIPDTEIDFVVTRLFFEMHPEVVQLVQTICPERIRIHPLTAAENQQVRMESRWREYAGWKIFCRYADELQASKALLMYSDHFQLPMLLGRAAPCRVSCIYFRPTFHYSKFQDYRPNWKQRIAAVRKQFLLSRVLKLDQIDTLFCLDPVAAEYIDNRFKTRARVLRLPDSFVRTETPDGRLGQMRAEFGIQDGRRILLLLGILDSRKGPMQLLQAAAAIPADAQRKLCLLIVGKLDPSIETDVKTMAAELAATTEIQIVMHTEYINDTEVQQYYDLSDVALTTYQQHMGMSSALIRAALAGIPVLSSSYGLMGELVRRHRLGEVVDTVNPQAFSKGIERMVTADDAHLFDATDALSFADSHSPESLTMVLKDWSQD